MANRNAWLKRSLFFWAWRACRAYYISIDQSSAPYLKTSDGARVDWSMGAVAALTDTSSSLRISSRGLHFYNHGVKPHGQGVSCVRSPDALCVLSSGSMVFPENSMPRYAFGNSHCGTESQQRLVTDNDTVYDLSVCDLIQGQLDVIYWQDRLHFDFHLFLPEWAYILTSAAVLYLVVSLGQNIARVMGDKEAVTHPLVTEVVCFALVALLLGLHDPHRIFVADHDRFVLWLVVAYLGLYLARHAFDLVMERYVYTFNVITVTLVFVTARLYCSFETPYTTVFLILLCTRFFHKLESQQLSAVERFTLVLDAVLIAFHYKYSYATSFWDEQMAPLYAVPIFVLCHTVGSITLSLEQPAK
jgi:hypothetical protein